jgi:hypothetical protein
VCTFPGLRRGTECAKRVAGVLTYSFLVATHSTQLARWLVSLSLVVESAEEAGVGACQPGTQTFHEGSLACRFSLYRLTVKGAEHILRIY